MDDSRTSESETGDREDEESESTDKFDIRKLLVAPTNTRIQPDDEKCRTRMEEE